MFYNPFIEKELLDLINRYYEETECYPFAGIYCYELEEKQDLQIELLKRYFETGEPFTPDELEQFRI